MMFRRLRQLDWVTGVLIPVFVILMESFCIYPWLIFMGKWPILSTQRPILNFASVIILIGGSFLITQYFTRRTWALSLIQSSIVASGLLMLFLVIRIEYSFGINLFDGRWFVRFANAILETFTHLSGSVLAIPAGFFLWWRGISRGRSRLQFDDVYPTFLIGIGTLVFLIIIWGPGIQNASFQNVASSIGGYIAGFFFCGLIAMALANLKTIQENIRAKEGIARGFGRRWLAIIAGMIGAIVLLGIGISSIFSVQVVSFLGKTLAAIYNVIAGAAYYLFYALGYVVQVMIYIGQWLMNLFTRGQTQPFQPINIATPPNLPESTTHNLSPNLVLILKWTFFVLVVAVIIFFIARAISRYRSGRPKEDPDEVSESLWSWDLFKADLKTFLKNLWPHRVRKPAPESPIFANNWQEETPSALSIREIYQRLLSGFSRLSLPHRRHETPNEYAQRIGKSIPESSEYLNELTALYVVERYGEQIVEKEKLEGANNLWKSLLNLIHNRIS